MRNKIVSFLISLLMIPPVSAIALDLADYTDPNYQYQDAEMGLSFSMEEGNQDQSSYNGSARIKYDMEYSTLPLKWNVTAEGDTDFSRGGNKEDSSRKNIRLDGGTTLKKYFGDYQGTFGYGSLIVGLRDLEDGGDDDPYTKISAGIGYGRITTATPLMDAVRCVEDLVKYGLLLSYVPYEVYMKLAETIAKEPEYKSRYGGREYEKYWYEDMEQILRESGILKIETLGALGIIKIQDILTDEPVLRRKHGWEAGVQVDYLISDYADNDGDPGLGVFFEYAKPYGFKWQFIERLEYATVLIDGKFGDAVHYFTNSIEMNYEMTDKIDWENQWELNVTLDPEPDIDDTYLNAVDTGLRFYISNTIDARSGINLSHRNQGENEDDEVDSRFYFELVYTIF